MGHVIACSWYYAAALWSPDLAGTWVEAAGLMAADRPQVYIACVYWTISTVGD
jgi:hypothetical protein